MIAILYNYKRTIYKNLRESSSSFFSSFYISSYDLYGQSHRCQNYNTDFCGPIPLCVYINKLCHRFRRQPPTFGPIWKTTLPRRIPTDVVMRNELFNMYQV